MVEKLKETKKIIPVVEKRAKQEAKKNSTIIQKCTCVNEFQDKMYGKGMRIKNSSGTSYKCTVCSSTK